MLIRFSLLPCSYQRQVWSETEQNFFFIGLTRLTFPVVSETGWQGKFLWKIVKLENSSWETTYLSDLSSSIGEPEAARRIISCATLWVASAGGQGPKPPRTGWFAELLRWNTGRQAACRHRHQWWLRRGVSSSESKLVGPVTQNFYTTDCSCSYSVVQIY